MTYRHKVIDKARHEETLFETTRLRKAMETVEFQFFANGVGTWDDVTTARDEYLVAWEDRRNFVLSEKYRYDREELERVIEEHEQNRV